MVEGEIWRRRTLDGRGGGEVGVEKRDSFAAGKVEAAEQKKKKTNSASVVRNDTE